MKKRNRRSNRKSKLSSKQRRSQAHRPRLEDLEPRRLLAGDLVLGPGNVQDPDSVEASTTIEELEQDVALADRITNDTIATAELIPLGFDFGEFTAVDIRGELIEPNATGALLNSEIGDPNAQPPIPPIEDSSILLANRVNHQSGNPIRIAGQIGDSLVNGQADADFYELELLEVGQTITVHLEAPSQGSGISQAVLVLYNELGQVLQTTDALDSNRGFGDTYMNWVVEEEGDYYVAVVPYSDELTFEHPSTPFRPQNVNAGASTATYDYNLTIGVDAVDIDYYAVELNPGDILGLSSLGAGNILSIYDPSGEFQVRSANFHGDFYPENTPLPQEGGTDLAYVADEAGTYFISVEGYDWSRYILQTRVFRPVIESAPAGTRQILFLDFDGAEVTPDTFLGPGTEAAIREFSPMRDFLTGFGLSRRDEDELIDAIVRVVEEDLNADLQELNPDAGVVIRNSRDHGELFGQPYVSRVVVGGTQLESLTPDFIGLANSIDIGNFDLEEDSFVLLDTLSQRNDVGVSPSSLNSYPLAPDASRIELIAAGIGGAISHEAGHFFGAFHTDSTNRDASIMNAGGPFGFDDLVGSGIDGIFGTVDDLKVAFAEEEYAHDEGSLYGINNVPGNLANVLVSGKGTVDSSNEGASGMTVNGTVYHDANANGVRDEGEGPAVGTEVFIDLNHDGEFSLAEPAAVTDATGSYAITDIPGVVGSLDILVVLKEGQAVTEPAAGSYAISVGSRIPADATFGVSGSVASGAGFDFGDAPASYGVAAHEIQSSVSLGATVTADEDSSIADTSDDGITLSNVVAGGVATGSATASSGTFAPGLLNGWVDFNQDGVFSSGEQVVRDVRFDGTTTFSFEVPSSAVSGATWARFRYGYVRGLGATGETGIGEVEDYPVIIAGGVDGGNGGGTTIELPVANNDSFTVTAGTTEALGLLNNDSNGFDVSTRIDSVGAATQGGSIVIASDGQSVNYTPADGFVGTDVFTYSIVNTAGSSSATVTVNVQADGTIDPGAPLALFRVETTGLDGAPITNIAPGEEFLLRVFTDDLRDGGAGVYAAYMDITFDNNLVTADGPVTFGSNYPAGQSPNEGVITAGSADGELDEYGAFGGFTSAIGDDEKALFTVPMTADAEGTVVFTANPADNLPRHEVLLFDLVQPINEDRIQYGTATLTIGDVQETAAFTNPANPRDVNNDGAVSARDALILINVMNANGAGPLTRDTAAVSTGFFLDVNGDDNLSAVDVLMIINEINNPTPTASGEPVVAAPAAIDAVFEADDDDEEDELFSL